ncbi:hypothetical protein N0V95_010077 [Ascochyta clinopodiicola]|nr:hypothetical protein N0V95_010077 [Ascochyta clinopodiicola]
MQDLIGLTLSTKPRRQENIDRLVYLQFYSTIKSLFNVSKVYVFDNQAVENLALDPGYVRSLQKQGGSISFNKKSCAAAYVHSKKRAAINLRDSQQQSYGTREEHCVSLAIMDEMCHLKDNHGADNALSPLLYYIVPSQELFGFLRAQINKYCLLFKHTFANTGRSVLLQETIVIVIALRALRFCYGSNMLAKESLLFKDRWERTRRTGLVVREGLGMQQTMANCGLGWFLPKFSWQSRRLAQPHEYLLALNLKQFDADVWSAMLAAHKTHPELSQVALEQNSRTLFCYRAIHRMFLKDSVRAPPHIVTGNQMRITKTSKLLEFLFLWDDNRERKAWGSLPFCLVLQQSFKFIKS